MNTFSMKENGYTSLVCYEYVHWVVQLVMFVDTSYGLLLSAVAGVIEINSSCFPALDTF